MSKHFRNPVYDRYFADPYVWRVADTYHAVGTGPRAGEDDGRVFTLLASRDLATWHEVGGALERPAAELGDTFWAPEVAEHEGRFYLYYSVGFDDKQHQLRVAVSDSPRGPYRDTGHALVDPAECPFAIDAHAFRDDDGQWYLFYARDFLDTDGGARVGTALVVQRMENMTRLAPGVHVVMRARHDWQRFQDQRPMYGGVYDWHTLEGPAVRKVGGRYYCFFSGGRWENDTYGVDYAIAGSPLGPYATACANGPRVLRTIPGRVIGPGHNSIVSSPEGVDYIVYHAWDPGMTARRMCIGRLGWTDAGPRLL